MLNAAIGDDAFRDGLRIYLNKFAFKNTQTSDLWDALSETSGTDVAKMMDAWLVDSRWGSRLVDCSQVADVKVALVLTLGRCICFCPRWPLPFAQGDQDRLPRCESE